MKNLIVGSDLIVKFKQYGEGENIKLDKKGLIITSPQPLIGDWLYIILIVALPLCCFIYFYLRGVHDLDKIIEGLIFSFGSFAFYLYLSKGNNIILFDFERKEISYCRKSLVARFFFKTKKIHFTEIKNVEIITSETDSEGYKERIFYYQIFLVVKNGKLLLIELTNTETNINMDLAYSMKKFIENNVLVKSRTIISLENPKKKKSKKDAE